MRFGIGLTLLLTSSVIWGHGGEDHRKRGTQISEHENIASVNQGQSKKDLRLVYNKINLNYKGKVKLLFQKSCFDCHSNSIKYPWYYQIPGVKQMIDHDTEEAKKHLDFSQDFPFKGHGNPLKDLKAISKSLENNTMPPLNYRVMHGDQSLNEKEVKYVQEWLKNSIRKIENE